MKNVFKDVMVQQYNKDRLEIKFVGKIWTSKQKKTIKKRSEITIFKGSTWRRTVEKQVIIHDVSSCCRQQFETDLFTQRCPLATNSC